MAREQIKVLLIGGQHNFDELGPILAEALATTEQLSVTTTTDWDELQEGAIDSYDAIVDYVVDYDTEMSDDQRSGLLYFVRDGGGYVGLHGAAAMFGVPDDGDLALLEEHERMLGGKLIDHPGVLETRTEIVDDEHPITSGMDDFSFVDEPYEFDYDPADLHVLAKTRHESFGEMPVAWTKSYGNGRVFYYAAGHDERAFRNSNFQTLVRQGIEWVSRRD